MADKLYEENSIRDIADAIREKNGTSDTYTVAEMGEAIRGIESGGGNWYDFTVEATSDLATTIEFADLLTPYLNNLEPMKDVAIVTMQNANVEYNSSAGPPVFSHFFKMKGGTFAGEISRYRNGNTLSTSIAISSGSQVTVKAGYKFYVKVVRVLV